MSEEENKNEEAGMFASKDFDQPAQPQLPTRAVGAICLVIGLLLGWWQILGPLQAAHRHEPSVSYEMRMQWMALACLLGSIPMLIFGDKIKLNQNERRLGWKQILLIVAILGIGIGFDQWLKGEFARLGYNTK